MVRIEIELNEQELGILQKLKQAINARDDSIAIRFAIHFIDVMLEYPPPSYFGEVVAKVMARLGMVPEEFAKPQVRLFPK